MDYMSVDFLKKSEESDSRNLADVTPLDDVGSYPLLQPALMYPSKRGLLYIVHVSIATIRVTGFVLPYRYLK